MGLDSNSSGFLVSPTLPTGDISWCCWFQWRATPTGFASIMAIDDNVTFLDVESNGASTSVECGAVNEGPHALFDPGGNAWGYVAGSAAAANGAGCSYWGQKRTGLPANVAANNAAARVGKLAVAAESAGGQLGPVIIGNFLVYNAKLTDAQLKAQQFQLAPMYSGCWAWLDFLKLLRVGKDRSGQGNNFTVSGTWVQSSLIPPVPEFGGRTPEIWLAAVPGFVDQTPLPIQPPRTARVPIAEPAFASTAAAPALVSYAPDTIVPPRAPSKPMVAPTEIFPVLPLPVDWFSDAPPQTRTTRVVPPSDTSIVTPPVIADIWLPSDPQPAPYRQRPPRISEELPSIPLAIDWYAEAAPQPPPFRTKPPRISEELPPIVLRVAWFGEALPAPRAPSRSSSLRPSDDFPSMPTPWVQDAPLVARATRPRAAPPIEVFPSFTAAALAWAPETFVPTRPRTIAPAPWVDPMPPLVLAVKTGWSEPQPVPFRPKRPHPEPILPLPGLAIVTLTSWFDAPQPQRASRRTVAQDAAPVIVGAPTPFGFEPPQPAIARRYSRPATLDAGAPPFAQFIPWGTDDPRPAAPVRVLRQPVPAFDVGPPIIVPVALPDGAPAARSFRRVPVLAAASADVLPPFARPVVFVETAGLLVPRRAYRSAGRFIADDGSIYQLLTVLPGFVNVGDLGLWRVSVRDVALADLATGDATAGRVKVSDARAFACIVWDAPVGDVKASDR